MHRCFQVLALLLIPIAAAAQTSRTTGALTGIVTDAQGNPLPGVTVTVTSPQLQGGRTAQTDAKGEYSLPLLPPGIYHAEYALAGLQNATRDNITISLSGDGDELHIRNHGNPLRFVKSGQAPDVAAGF